MLFGPPNPTAPQIEYVSYSSISVNAAERQFSKPLLPENKGKGGPIDALINPPEKEEPSEPKSKPRAIVDRYNKLNYSNAIWPVDPPEVSSDFGWRTPPCDGCSADHKGTDFVPGRGADVVAVLDGLVVEAGVLGGYGTWVKLEHRVPSVDFPGEYETWETVYAHLQTDSIPNGVGVGSIVKKGDLLGLVGDTGQSTGDHLHFEITVNGEHKNPLPLLATYQVIEYMPDGSEEFIRYK
jgi:murein DD-endopeptidase MepM/ murein hydrolase activator NlpD